MKTKEEILEDQFGHAFGLLHPIMHLANIEAAMQTYADQECAAKDAEIAELKRRVAELAADRNDLHDRLFKALDMLG